MAISKRLQDDSKRRETSVRDAARAILELARPHQNESSASNDREQRVEGGTSRRSRDNRLTRERVVQRSKMMLRRGTLPQAIVPLERSIAMFPVVIPDDGADRDERCSLRYHQEESNEGDNGTIVSNRLPLIEFRNYREGGACSRLPGDINTVVCSPSIGKPLAPPPRLQLVAKNRQKHTSPTSVCKVGTGVSMTKCLAKPPSLFKIPMRVKYQRPSKD
ncbi:hypothetical protein IV203_033150 [Nitzschia inconspicua]|uniref:Uncharacterized protein n=1 Tax=Nitzschia inconspicua TaxID=303405 RepID=A0A9K3KKV1_9STRA|nr:hypothetical protein IV203_033150 [Nitzschia inconspicua]